MKVSFLCENVNKKLSLVNHAVSNRSQLPILLNFLFKAEKGKLTISATDLEIGIEATVPANIEEEGGITVPAKTFYELLSSINKGRVSLYTKENNLCFETEKIKTNFQTIKAEEFPKIYEEKGEKMGVLTKDTIEKELPGMVFAASQDLGRPALSGILMGKTKGKTKGFFMVATDGYRLSIRKERGDGEENPEGNFLIPAKIMRELTLLKDGGDVDIYTSSRNNHVLLKQEDVILTGRLIEAEFPSYRKIIPQDFSTRIIIDKVELLGAVKTCFIFARESANIIKFSLEKKRLVVSASAPSVGETTIEVEASLQGEENEIAFNARYVMEFLSNIEAERVVFEMTGPLNPGVFKIEGDPDYLHIIMPIRVQGDR